MPSTPVDFIIYFDSIRTSTLDRETVTSIIAQRNIPFMVFSTGAADESYSGIAVRYRDALYATTPIHAAPVRRDPNGEVLAVISDGREERPLIVRSNDRWHVACELQSGLISWIVADVLHDFLGEPHLEEREGLFIVEEVDLLRAYRIPFVIAVEPVARSPDDGRLHTAKDVPEWADAIRYMVDAGGTVVLDGSELEPLDPKEIAKRISQGIAFLCEIGVYPIALYASRSAAERLEAAPEHASFSTTVEYASARLDESRYSDTPYVLADQTVVYPESIGSAGSAAAVNQLISRARRMMAVRDALLGVGLNASLPYELAEAQAAQFAREPIMWMDIRHAVHLVETDFIRMESDGSGVLDVQILNRSRMTEWLKVEHKAHAFESFAYYLTWILVVVVGVFVVMFVLFAVLTQRRRARRLFAEKELD
jgi:hypothetical protein